MLHAPPISLCMIRSLHNQYVTRSSSLCNFIQSPVTSPLTVQNIFLKFPLSVTQIVSKDLSKPHNMFMFCSKKLLAAVVCLWLFIEHISGAYIHTVTHLHTSVRACVCVCVRACVCVWGVWGGVHMHMHCHICTFECWILQGSLKEHSNKHFASEKLVLSSLYWMKMCCRWYTPDLNIGTTES